ncbi:hypothetical protein Gorai_024003 [Gossypium raimondii]|uniref:Uncharacterized protein n=1 Tax=Gossypium raimondii TaxID=29730 RepID=A0A7J8NXZ7_GOSRA|nr:hypothetical protein [Gossypium raimondii]
MVVVELDVLLVVQFLRQHFENNHLLGNSCVDHLTNLAQNFERGLVHLESPSASLEPFL